MTAFVWQHTWTFPTVLIFLDVAAASHYLIDGDIRRCLYWLFAAGLTACVTYA